MQLTGSTAELDYDVNQLITDWRYNLAAGVQILRQKYEDAASGDAACIKTSELSNRGILENWFYGIRFYNGYKNSSQPGYLDYLNIIYGYVQAPPSRLSDLYSGVVITKPATAFGGAWVDGKGFAALLGNTWKYYTCTDYSGTIHSTSCGTQAQTTFSVTVTYAALGLPVPNGTNVSWGPYTRQTTSGVAVFINVPCETHDLSVNGFWVTDQSFGAYAPCGTTQTAVECERGDCTTASTTVAEDGQVAASAGFVIGDRVEVYNTGGIGLRAWNDICNNGYVVKPDGRQGLVLDGPRCCKGYDRWQIRWDGELVARWSAEGDRATGEYWLMKISGPAQPILSVSPGDQSVGAGAGLAHFNVSNSGNGAMNWSAGNNDSWLHITSGASGTNSGTIQSSCDANPGSNQRIGTIQVTATGASGSPMNVTVTQAGMVTLLPQPPDIVVTYQSRTGPEIVIGDFTPSTSDGTDFANIPIRDDVQPAYRTFVIQNYGTGALQLTGSPIVQVSGSSDFTIFSQPPITSLCDFTGTTCVTGFTVQFDPHAPAGLKVAILSIQSNDANHSPYQFAIQGTGVLPTLSVTSDGASDVPIAVSPSDTNGQTNGTTPFTLYYVGGTQVALTAPATAGASVFTGWTGSLNNQSGTTAYVTLTDIFSPKTATANYSTPIRTLTIQSNGTAAVSIGVSPFDRNGQGDGTTDFARSFDNGAFVALTAPSTSGGNVFIDWSGVDGQIGTIGYVTLDDEKTVTASYVAVVPLDLNGDGYVDNADLTAFVACALGPTIPQNNPGCPKADFDRDGYVDIIDFAVLQRCWSGTALADPNCAAPPPPDTCRPSFADDFSRPDGPVVNGWLATTGNTGGNLVIRTGALSTPGAHGDWRAGVYRPIDPSASVTIEAMLTHMNGYGGLLNRYDVGFLFGSTGDISSGYGVFFGRGDQNYSDSTVALVFNGVLLDSVSSSSQFGASIMTTFTCSPDGSITGSVTDGVSTFDFGFGPRTVTLLGSNFAISQGFPDERSSLITNPTVDNLSVAYPCGGP